MAIGYNTMTTNSAGGSLNVAVGNYTLDALTSGDSNTAVGYNALTANTSGSGNCAFGSRALQACHTGGAYNIAMGLSAGTSITTGTRNVMLGHDTAPSGTTGSRNICIGAEAGYSGSPGGNLTTGSNGIYLGPNEISAAHIQVDWTVASDERDKTDVEPITMGLDFVNKLEPVTYHWDKRTKYVSKEDLKDGSVDLNDVVHDGTHKEDWTDVGFLAQAVEKIEEDYGHKMSDKSNLTTHLTEDGAYGLTYAKFVPILTKAIQELSAKVEAQQSEIDTLKNA
jgi:hypothetical protein